MTTSPALDRLAPVPQSVRGGGRQILHGLRTRLAVTTALASMALVGYGRGAYAGDCTLIAGTYQCTGAAVDGVDITQIINSGGAVNVEADATFGIDTTTNGGNALEITGYGGLTFTDNGNASQVTGNDYGIYANNYDSGALSITSTGHVTGNDYDGIYAYNGDGTTSLTISAATVTGGYNGIAAENNGTAGLSVTVSGDVTGNGGDGIYTFNSANDVSASTVINQAAGTTTSGYYDGIYAINHGGSLKIEALGTSLGTVYHGVHGTNGSYFIPTTATDLTITSNNAEGGEAGIYAENFGSGALTITSTGQATGHNAAVVPFYANLYAGITAYNSYYGTSLTIQSNNAQGGEYGIAAVNVGSGALSITSTGQATGTDEDGIYGINSPYGTDLTINAHDATGGDDAIEARNFGTGAVSVTATGALNADDDGVEAYNSGNGDLTVRTEGTIIAGDDGIYAENYGNGSVSITTTGAITAGDEGIEAYNSSNGGGLSIDVRASITADENGIETYNYGSGPTTITVSGAVMGGSTSDDYGIYSNTDLGGNTIITLNSGGSVGALSGQAIYNDSGDSSTTVNTGASISGSVSLGDGSDNLTFNGGDFSATTTLDGGDDIGTADGFVDTLTFMHSSGTVAGSDLVNWENVTIGVGSTLKFSDDALSTLQLGVDGGTLSQQNGEEDAFALTGDLVLENDGTLAFDVFSETSFDTFDVSGLAAFGPDALISFLFDPLFMPPGEGTELTFLTAGGITGFDDLRFDFVGLDLSYGARIRFDDTLGSLSLHFVFVPAPPTITVLATGLVGLFGWRGWQRRRNRTTAAPGRLAA